MLRSERLFELPWGKVRVLNSRRHPDPYAKTWINFPPTPRIKRDRVFRILSKMAVHTISILFPSYYSDFKRVCLNFVSYKLSKIFETITIVKVFQCQKYCGRIPKKSTIHLSQTEWNKKVILTSMCHVTKTVKINNHKQKLKGCTLIKRLLLAANYNTMISQPLSRVFSFHNMAKAGKENQCGFSVLPAAARVENLGAKLGGRQLHISHNAPCLRKHCFHFLQKKLKTKFM